MSGLNPLAWAVTSSPAQAKASPPRHGTHLIGDDFDNHSVENDVMNSAGITNLPPTTMGS
jgi:hypothetical protein